MILFYVVMIIACFALGYVDLGILTSNHCPINAPASCLYFSAVTFTTLGYGDFAPSEATRFVAVLEAMWGYFTLGTLVAVGIKIIATRSPRKDR